MSVQALSQVVSDRNDVSSASTSRVAVCTLYEGDHHFGLGALVNSLYAHGYRGVVWAGYRGDLPPWTRSAKAGDLFHEFQAAPNCVIRFVPLKTKVHFTNFKADFMLHVFDLCGPEIEAVAYFDPDIVIKCRWSFFEEWTDCGVALVKDVNAGMTATHPFRTAWKQHAASLGLTALRDMDCYCNAGFIGVRREWSGFLETLRDLIAALPVSVDVMSLNHGDRSNAFYAPDQDNLNIAAMCSDAPLSIVGPEAMDFIPGGFIMSHAIGTPKPWQKKLIRSALAGVAPRAADKAYWRYAETPIRLFAPVQVSWKRFTLRCGAALGRLIRRG